MTLSIMTLSIMTLSIMTLSIMSLSIMILSIMTLSIKCLFANLCYQVPLCSVLHLFIAMLNGVMLSVIMVNVVAPATVLNKEPRHLSMRSMSALSNIEGRGREVVSCITISVC